MRLERLALWEEKFLFTEQGKPGFIGWCKGVFAENGLELSNFVALQEESRTVSYELERLCSYLAGEGAEHLLRSLSDMTTFCRERVHDHVPYSFNRECWGFRVLTEELAWYMALTPWNAKRHIQILCYDRQQLMAALAKAKGLPEHCYGVLKYTGERIQIRYGADMYESFPQYGGNMVENRAYADRENAALGITVQQVSAMENGVLEGWDMPEADPKNYDENGRFYVPDQEMTERRR